MSVEIYRTDGVCTSVRIVNATPHDVVVFRDGPDRPGTVYPASGMVARVATSTTEVAAIGGVPVRIVATGDVEGIPPRVHDGRRRALRTTNACPDVERRCPGCMAGLS